MDTTMIILLIAGIIVLLVGFVAMKKYARKVYSETGYNPFSKGNQWLMAAILVLPLVVGYAVGEILNDASQPHIVPMVSAALVPIAALVVRNLKMKSPGRIILFTLFQVIGGLLIVLFFLIKVVTHTSFSMADTELSGTQNVSARMTKDKISREAPEYQTGLDRQKADRIARENGFRDADDVENKA